VSTEPLDVVIAGGGLVGAVAALALAGLGRRVRLVERERPAPVCGRFGVDVRNVACSPASRALLQSVGVWPALRRAPYQRMEVWEEQGTARLEFSAAEAGRTELGWILENGQTLDALWTLLEREPRVEIVLGSVTEVDVGDACVRVVTGTESVTARLLVGADGTRSAVRSLLGVELDRQETGQHALATAVRTGTPHGGTALQRFLLDGPLALLPSRLPDVCSVVWSQSPDEAARRSVQDDDAFCAELTRATEGRAGTVLEVDRRLTFPLSQQLVRDFNPASRVLLIGDAARVLHPLAGLGANVGFEDVRDLCARARTLPVGMDLGAAGIWRGFARRRRMRARLMLAAMTTFKNAYGDGEPFRQWLRNVAVDWVNQARPLKRQLIREALGIGPLAAPW
jgi:2-octaprenylphenol hydroxylase